MFAIALKELQKNLFVAIAYLVLTLLMSLMFNNYDKTSLKAHDFSRGMKSRQPEDGRIRTSVL